MVDDDPPRSRPVASPGGYNNDVVKGDKSYHVLTEDLGEAYGVIVTQTFCEGSIVATRKVSYPSVADPVERRAAVKRLMQEQHKAAMRALVTPRRNSSLGPMSMAPQHTPSFGIPVVGSEASAQLVGEREAAMLEVVGGPHTGERVPLYASPLSFGAAGALVLPGVALEPLAAMFARRADGWTIIAPPGGSQVRVDGAPITAAVLSHGARVEIGAVELDYLELESLGRVVRERRHADARATWAVRPTLLPLLAAERASPRSFLRGPPEPIEQALAALAAVGPTSTPALFGDRESRLAYYLDAFVALAKLTILDVGGERALDGRAVGVIELDRLLCEQNDPRIYAAVARALGHPLAVSFTADELDQQLDQAMEALANDSLDVRVDAHDRRVYLPHPAWPFLGTFERGGGGSAVDYLRAFAGPRRAAALELARADEYAVAFVRHT